MTTLTHHGGRLSDARAEYGGAATDWLDLSTGINPRGWVPPASLSVDWRGLPDPAALARLERTAAREFGVEPDRCLAVPGSESALRALAQVLQLPGRTSGLSYSTHSDAFAHAPAARGEADVLVLANPNNPDGTVLSPQAVLEKLEQQERRGGWLLVDEAFVECLPDLSVAGQVADTRRLIVTRSFGKFFGLAGVRLGFVIAPMPLLARLRHLQGEWPVCAAALAYGTRAYDDAEWIARARHDLAGEARALDAVLARHGLAPRGECALFRLVETERAGRLFEALARQHVLTRAFADHPRLLRFGLPGSEDALARLDKALADA